jgi:hypothetical protein
VLLDVEGAATCIEICQRRAFGPIASMSSNIVRVGECIHIPQRRQSVCVLLWRLPKLEVPFAVSQSVSRIPAFAGRLVSRTHLMGWGLKNN